MERDMNRGHVLCTLVVVFTAAVVQAAEPLDNPDAVVELLVTGHEDRSNPPNPLYERLAKDPDRYVEAVKARLVLPKPIPLTAEQFALSYYKARKALELVRLLGAKHGEALLWPFLQSVWERREEFERQVKRIEADQPEAKRAHAQVRGLLMDLHVATFAVMGDLGDRSAVEYVLSHLAAEQDLGVVTTMRYLAKVAKGDAAVAKRVREIIRTKAPRLGNISEVKLALREMDGPAATQPAK